MSNQTSSQTNQQEQLSVQQLKSEESDLEEEHPSVLIPQLLKQFYTLGWVTGTGGGISIRHHNLVFIAPSGVQKERVEARHLFVADVATGDYVSVPGGGLRPSACTPLFMLAFRLRDAGAVIHTHSNHAVLATLMWPGGEFRCTHLEMMKGVRDAVRGRALRYDETLVVPIIENTCHEEELVDSMREAILAYPSAVAVLVRRHGVYVWGETWQQAKTTCECLDYLFNLCVQMKQLQLDPESGV